MSGSSLPVLGAAPEFSGIEAWLNTPGEQPLTLRQLRGKVVLVDFWTYSCINCIRTLPHLRAWYAAYHRAGLEIVGVHTPEFAFEHVRGNVSQATEDLHVTWPVALDNRYKTWDAYSNQYWPAEYLVDRLGRVREAHFGEGEYGATEQAIRSLLAANPTSAPRARRVADSTPTAIVTPETYLGYARIDSSRYRGTAVRPRKSAIYQAATRLGRDELSYAGRWTIGDQRAIAGRDARLRLHFHAHNVYLVLGGSGRVHVFVTAARHGRSTSTAIVSIRWSAHRRCETACSNSDSNRASTHMPSLLASRAGALRDNERMARVLVVDDEPIVRDVVARYLERDGHATLASLRRRDGAHRCSSPSSRSSSSSTSCCLASTDFR